MDDVNWRESNKKMEPNFIDLEDFGYNSSPMPDQHRQVDDFTVGVGVDTFRFADTDYDYNPFDLDISLNTGMKALHDDCSVTESADGIIKPFSAKTF